MAIIGPAGWRVTIDLWFHWGNHLLIGLPSVNAAPLIALRVQSLELNGFTSARALIFLGMCT